MHSSVSSFCQFSFRSLPPLSLLQSLNFPPPPPQSSESECENDDEGDQLEPVIQFPRQTRPGCTVGTLFSGYRDCFLY